MQATIDKLKEKKILIWGYGREGRSTEKLIRGYCAPAALDIYEGPREGVHEENYDYVFVSPGIPFEEDAPAYDNRKFTSQTELFLEEYGRQTIGITGTKGKTTTTYMVRAILEAAGSCYDQIVKTTIFLQDMNDFGKVNEIYQSYFKQGFPARSCVQIGRLPLGGLVEVECVAVITE